MNEKTIKYWREVSDYDIETARAMLKTKRYLYVGFMCHQAIEKSLKAYYVKVKNIFPPYTHNLLRLAEEGEIYNYFSEEQKIFLKSLQPMNIEARYPKYKEDILKQLSEEKCKIILKKAKELHRWIIKKLEKY